MQTRESAFYIDMRDGTLEQHLSDGEVRTFPPSNGKSVSPLVTAVLRDGNDVQHMAIVGSTRAGMSTCLPLASSPARSPSGKCSRLLATLLSRR